jgi:hypothetical protein
MNINLEVERLMRVFFVQTRLMLADDRRDAKRKHSDDIHKANMVKAIDEKHLAETEKVQLRSSVSVHRQILKVYFVGIIFDIL